MMYWLREDEMWLLEKELYLNISVVLLKFIRLRYVEWNYYFIFLYFVVWIIVQVKVKVNFDIDKLRN